MNELSFNIKTTEDFFKKLIEEFNEFKIDMTSSRVALELVWEFYLAQYAFSQIFRTGIVSVSFQPNYVL